MKMKSKVPIESKLLSMPLAPTILALDLDGTITEPSLMGTFVHKVGAEKHVASALRILDNAYQNVKQFKQTSFPDLDLGSNRLKKGLLSMVAKPKHGIKDIFNAAQDLNILTSVISHNSISLAEKIFFHNSDVFTNRFDGLYFIETMRDGTYKPNPETILKVKSDLLPDDSRPATIWMVGDMASDMDMAIQAGRQSDNLVIPVSMGHGSSAHKYLQQYTEEHPKTLTLQVDDLPQLVQVVKIAFSLSREHDGKAQHLDANQCECQTDDYSNYEI